MTNIVHVRSFPGNPISRHVTVVPLSDGSRTKFRVEFAGVFSRVYMPVNPLFVIFLPVS